MSEPIEPDAPPEPEEPSGPDWYLQDWAKLLGKRQADLSKTFGWTKNSAHKIWHGKQAYSRKVVNEIAAWLQIAPYELLMPPKEALTLRRLREAANAILAEEGQAFRRDK